MKKQCPECGAEIQKRNAVYCEACGAVLKSGSRKRMRPAAENGAEQGIHTYVLRCKSCGGTLNEAEDGETLICPYCGSREVIEESDAVKIEKIRSEAYKEVELGRQRMIHERLKEKEKSDESLRFRRSRSFRLTVIILVISLLGLMGSAYAPYSRIIALIQVALLILTFLLGFRVFKKARPGLHRVTLAIAAALILVYIGLYSNDGYSGHLTAEEIDWDSLTYSAPLPRPESTKGIIYTDTADTLSMELEPFTEAQFKSYVSACKQAGYTVDQKTPYQGDFEAYNEAGEHIELYHYGSLNSMSLRAQTAIRMSEFKWPAHGLAALLPAPPSTYGKIVGDSTDYFNAYVGNMDLEAYTAYVSDCMDAGFTVDHDRTEEQFRAKNADNVAIRVVFRGFQTVEIWMSQYTD